MLVEAFADWNVGVCGGGGNGIVALTVGVDITEPGTEAKPKFAAIVTLSMLALRPGAALRGVVVVDDDATDSDRYASKARQSMRTVSRPRRSAIRSFFIAEWVPQPLMHSFRKS